MVERNAAWREFTPSTNNSNHLLDTTLVKRDENSVGFLHRSLQEFLAAKQMQRLPSTELQKRFATRGGDPAWQEVLLGVLYLLKRPDEVDALLNSLRTGGVDPLSDPLRKILLSRAVFGDLNCSAAVAEDVANEILGLVEASTWMPLRHSLLQEVVGGMDSELVGNLVRQKLERWFPSRARFPHSLCHELALKPTNRTGHRFFNALFNIHDLWSGEVAEAIGDGAGVWPELADRLRDLVLTPAEAERSAVALHALALGWPDHVDMQRLLLEGSTSRADAVRAVALIHRARRGDDSVELMQALSGMCGGGHSFHNWGGEIVNALLLNWPKDRQLRSEALFAASHSTMPTKWDHTLALSFLLRAWPGDDEVAELIADIFRREKYLSILHTYWPSLLDGFTGHRLIVPAAEEWLEKHGTDPYIYDVAQLAMLGRSHRCKAFLIDGLRNGRFIPGWPVHALIEIAGPADPEVQQVAALLMRDQHKLGAIAQFLPKLIEDREECEQRLISILRDDNGLGVVGALQGLDQIGRGATQTVLDILTEKLGADADNHFWWKVKFHLLKNFPQVPIVREAALKELENEEAPLSALASAYAEDPDFRERLELLLEPLHEDLRLTLARAVAPPAKRGSGFARRLLSRYRFEPEADVRTAAVSAYCAAELRSGDSLDAQEADLIHQMTTHGMGYFERNQAAAAGLIVLKRFSALAGSSSQRGEKNVSSIPVRISGSTNWDLVRAVVENWEDLEKTYGQQAWHLLDDWTTLVIELVRSGKRNLALNLPQEQRDLAAKRARHDVDSFRALEVLGENKIELRDLCLSIFEGLIPDPERRTGWSHGEMLVAFEAARYLATHYPGDGGLGQRLEEIAQKHTVSGGPWIALCRGWPNSPMVSSAWESYKNSPTGGMGPKTAWMLNAKANANEFASHVVLLRDSLQRREPWDYPRETLNAIFDRLQRDREARRLLLDKASACSDANVRVSLIRLLGRTMTERKELSSSVSQALATLGERGKIPEFCYDILEGRQRPVAFCLIESCLTKPE